MNTRPHRAIYALYDKVANDLIGHLFITRHVAAAVRTFSDVAALPDSLISKHVEDYELIQLGFLNDDNEIIPARETILTGTAWQASQQRPDITPIGAR